MSRSLLRTLRPIALPAALCALAAACTPPASVSAAAAEDDHEEEPAVVVTVWEDGHELFVEYHPPVVGEPFQLVTHVSRLADGAPGDGPIAFALSAPSGAARRVEIPEPARTGIYLPEITLDEVGAWGAVVEVGDAARVPLPDVVVYASEAEAHAAPLPPEPEGTSFLKEQQWRIGTRTELVSERELDARILVPASVRAVPARRGVVGAPVAGRLEPPPGGALPGLGESLEAGALVGFVRPPWSDLALRLAEARAALPAAEIELAQAERSYARIAELFERQARSQRELEQAEFERDAAVARRDAAVAALEAIESMGVELGEDGIPRYALRAPVAGRVQAVGATLGELVDPEHAVLTLLDTSAVLVEARPSPEQLERVDPARAPIFLHHGSTAEATHRIELEARLVFVADEVAEPSHTVPVVYEVQNPERELRVNELLEVALSAGAQRSVLAVPETALVDDGGEPVAYVQLGGETFERRALTLGARSGGFVEVLAGLDAGERIAVKRAHAIRLAAASGSVPAHHH